jgi:hypothetical protein
MICISPVETYNLPFDDKGKKDHGNSQKNASSLEVEDDSKKLI